MLADVVEKVLPPIAGAITGGLIGIISSYLTWQRQNKYEQKNIAYLLYQEFYIRSLLINQMLLTLKNLKPVDDYIYRKRFLFSI
ncbi:hypothetical protein [Nostoc sp. ATCC 53789]|uniref:hypothetical protein n=1 Tax=Nostoc sp. ATCC 53789 TaxID=76335 RepID=UPI000DECC1EA|nr:hypothetical protein [Nostoc sp. ATCC 53789]QHG21051.1 hypothetical protein GJB62_34935 [Nostoc sp. ATCC 53789]RCJ16823.1 hypothetical protein A6V25_30120 [Nostoc sp. ATCC 53789]